MKRKTLLSLFTICLLSWYGCELTNDHAAYDNPNFNEVIVDTAATEVPSTVLQFDTLRINPVITQTEQSGESNLSYEWTVRTNEEFINDPMDEEVRVISNEKNLVFPVTLITRDWKFVLTVTDENTGVSYSGYFIINVQNQFSAGWLLLEEVSGEGDLSIILPDGSIFRRIYSDINPSTPLGMPLRQLVVTNFPFGTDELSILSANGAVGLDYNELLKISDYQDWFWTAPDVITPEYHVWHGTSNGWIINDGLVHLQVRGGFPGEKKYSAAMAFPDDVGTNYEAAPFVAEGSSPYTAAIYDNQGQYFVHAVTGLSSTLQNFPPVSVGAPFDMNDVGLEMVYMEAANEADLHNAVMKDESDVYYMLQIRLDQQEAADSYQQMTRATNIENHTAFESSQTLERMYYSVDNQIYLYDIPSGLLIGSPLALPAGETVTDMEIDENTPNELVVATWDGSEGRVHILSISGTGELTLSETYEGFGEIIDMDYKD